MKFEFRADDFNLTRGPQHGVDFFYAADLANAKLAKHLESLPVVYKQPGFCGHSWQESLHDANNRTHKAILFNIEELKPKECKHEPDWVYVFTNGAETTCLHCKAKLKVQWILNEKN